MHSLIEEWSKSARAALQRVSCLQVKDVRQTSDFASLASNLAQADKISPLGPQVSCAFLQRGLSGARPDAWQTICTYVRSEERTHL